MLFPTLLVAGAYWPVESARPTTAAQTWIGQEDDHKVDLSGGGRFSGVPLNNSGKGILGGYDKIDSNSNDSCGSGVRCVIDDDYVLLEVPNFDPPSDQEVTRISSGDLSDLGYELTEGIYEFTSDELKLDRRTLTILGSVTLYAEKVTVENGGTIDVVSENPSDFILVADDEVVYLKDAGTIYGYLFNNDEVSIDGTHFVGGVVTQDLNVKNSGEVEFVYPSNSFAPDICEAFPGTAQTWTGNTISTQLGVYSSKVLLTEGGTPTVGFESEAISWDAGINGCNSEPCISNSDYIKDKLDFPPVFLAPTNPDYERLSVWQETRAFADNEAFGDLSIGASTVTFEEGEYWIGSLNVNNSSTIEIPSGQKVTFHVKTINSSGSSIINQSGGGELYIYAHSDNPDSQTISFNSGSTVNAFVYSEGKVDVSGSDQTGAITASAIDLNSTSTLTGSSPAQCNTPEPEPTYDICHYIREEFQSNLTDTNGKPLGDLVVDLSSTNFDWGDSDLEDLINAFQDTNAIVLSDSSRALSFNDFSNLSSRQGGCYYTDRNWWDFPWQNCDVDSNKSLGYPVVMPDFQDDGSNGECKNNRTCSLGSDRIHKKYTLGNKATLRLEAGEYWFEELEFKNSANIILDSTPVQIHFKSFKADKGALMFNAGGAAEDLLFVGHTSSGYVELKDKVDDSIINAYFYIPPETASHHNHLHGFEVFGDDNTFTGGVAAPHISIGLEKLDISKKRGTGNRFTGQIPPQCSIEPPTDVFEIEIKPYNFHLTCESNPDNIVEVHVLDEDGNLLSGYQPTLIEDGSSALTISFLPESNGVVQYRVTKNNTNSLGDYDLKATLSTDGQTFTDTDEIKYVPYKFSIADQNVFAGEDVTVPVGVQACSDDGDQITLGYSGSPEAVFSYERPNATPISDDLSFSADLDDSNRNATLNFKESGRIRVTIEDKTFVCNEEKCPSEGGALQGEFEVSSRPWKIGVCNVVSELDGKDNPASTTGTPSFTSAASNFNVTYRPIVHPDSANGESLECKYPITGNYALDSGPIEINYELAYPASGDVGSVTPTVDAFQPSDGSDKTVLHMWSEVGTIKFTTSAEYLGLDVLPFNQNIGRFYPDYFNTLSNSWIDPSGQSFTYMNQPFGEVHVVVAAYSALNNEVSNYASFNSNHQALFSLEDDDDRLVNADASSLDAVSSYAGSRWQLNSSVIEWSKQSNLEPDGPFNVDDTVFDGSSELISSIQILESVVGDPVQFLSTSSDTNSSDIQELPDEHPRVVFGRVNLNDVGGVEGSEITVPLQVQYWNGNAFVNNTSDSFTDIDAEMDGSQRVIWPAGAGTSVTLEGSAEVESGVSNSFTAKQDPDSITREQVQMWQELNSSDNYLPWLQFDWDQNGIGEENPSTIVTFGIHRGNDRVIYRGEPGL
ncbi:DUF6701 domain-containing protein [Vibrio splendidus]